MNNYYLGTQNIHPIVNKTIVRFSFCLVKVHWISSVAKTQTKEQQFHNKRIYRTNTVVPLSPTNCIKYIYTLNSNTTLSLCDVYREEKAIKKERIKEARGNSINVVQLTTNKRIVVITAHIGTQTKWTRV